MKTDMTCAFPVYLLLYPFGKRMAKSHLQSIGLTNHAGMVPELLRNKKRRCIYAKTLTELRKKEDEIRRDIADGIDYAAGKITVAELVDRYINLKRGLKQNSMRAYGSAVNRIHADSFGQKPVKSVKLSDAKGWFVFLHDKGIKQNTIGVLQSVIRPAFEMAVDDDLIRKNPFKFKLSDVIPKDAYTRDALTKEQQEQYLQFVQDCGGNYYNDIVILLGTGLRVRELYGLIRSDIDFERRCIHVRRQLCRTAEKPYFITAPKTKSGIRTIPMTDAVYLALKRTDNEKRTSPKVDQSLEIARFFRAQEANLHHTYVTMSKISAWQDKEYPVFTV